METITLKLDALQVTKFAYLLASSNFEHNLQLQDWAQEMSDLIKTELPIK